MPFVKLKDKQPARYADTVFYYPRYDTCNRHRFLGADGMPEDTEWLDESVTEDMVKDLEFLPDPCSKLLRNQKYAQTPRGKYLVGELPSHNNKWAISICGGGYKPCDSEAHGIELCNQHHKEYILSQLK